MWKWGIILCLSLLQEKDATLREAIDSGFQLLEKGEYREAEKTFRELLDDGPNNARILLGLGRVYFETGRYDDSKGQLEKSIEQDKQNPETPYWLGELFRTRGDYSKAIEQFERSKAAGLEIPSLERKARALWDSGKRADAKKAWKEITSIAAKRIVEDSRELYFLGLAYERFKKYSEASQVYIEAIDKNPGNVDAYRALGELYLKSYGDAEGTGHKPEAQYRDALKKNPRAVEVLLSLYELFSANFAKDQSETEDFIKRALAVNPNSQRAILIQTDSLLQDRRFSDADSFVKKALAINPQSLRALSYQAAVDYVLNRQSDFKALETRVLETDPQFGEFYAVLGALLKDLYRFQDAIPWLKKALELDSDLSDARNDLGQCLVHSGQEAEGRKVLEEAEKADPGFVHPWRHNMLVVLKELEEKYIQTKDSPYIYFFHANDSEVLKPYLLPLYQDAWKFLSEKYGYTPKAPILVETFHEAGDFSTRTIGFTGFGALGACFGPVVTAVSPAAVDFRRHFNYLETAWHEFTHVITLGLSNGRVPRWLTEGLSTYEEKQKHPSYDRGMDLDLLDAYWNGEIYPVIELNKAFRGPRIIFGYYQGGLICEFLAQEFSFSQIIKMVRLYGEDKDTEEIFQTCFGISTKEFDQRFMAYVEKKLTKVRAQPRLNEKTLKTLQEKFRKNPKDIEALRHLTWSSLRRGNLPDAEIRLRKLQELDPNDAVGFLIAGEIAAFRKRTDVALKNYQQGFDLGAEEFFSRVHYANVLEEEKNFEEAKKQYRLAKAAFPFCRDPKLSPHLALRRMLEGEGKLEEAMAEVEEFAALDGSVFQERLELAKWYTEKKNFEKANQFYAEANGVDPFHRDLHVEWAKLLREVKRYDESVREWRVARLVRPDMEWPPVMSKDPDIDKDRQVELWLEQAETEKVADKIDAARESALQALDLDPENSSAKNFLEELKKAVK